VLPDVCIKVALGDLELQLFLSEDFDLSLACLALIFKPRSLALEVIYDLSESLGLLV
jgi:hypothetical protein